MIAPVKPFTPVNEYMGSKGAAIVDGALTVSAGRGLGKGVAGIAERAAIAAARRAAAAEALSNTSTTIHMGSQGKHMLGHNNYIPGKSPIDSNINPQKLLDGVHNGQHPIVGLGARGQPVVDFGRQIGTDAASGARTQYGTIHSSKHGAHIVPAGPTTIGW